jgi:hypothetical protein
MNLKNTFLIIVVVIFFVSIKINAQTSWRKIEKQNYSSQKELFQKKNFPSEYEILSMDINAFSNNLKRKSAQKEIIELPNSDGSLSKFFIKESSNFEEELQAKFPNILSYSAQGIDDLTAVAKISIGTDGFHAIISSGKKETVYIDSYSKDYKDFIIYERSSLSKVDEDFKCQVAASAKKDFSVSDFSKNADDGKLRTFRLALVGTGEYSQFHLNRQNVSVDKTDDVKKAAVLSAMNTSMTRVNSLFERDLSVRFIIVSNNEQLIFLDPVTDNLSNDDTSPLINETQSVCDATIGVSNYDIGHTFSTGAGGLAGLGVVCVSGSKARGVTGIGSPVGDPFDVDYVAHEIGHQFGANHTFNNSCSGNRNSSTAVEPGSGTTIMAYAGICFPNVQSGNPNGNSDDHFHTISLAEMWATIQTSADCASLSDTNNVAPIANAGIDFSIPKSTPFVLEGTATDADGLSSLTYNWEQLDIEIGEMPPVATSAAGPLFRSLPSKASPNRYMPDLATVVNGNISSTWEVLPSVARELNFSFLVRDNHAGGGSTARDDMKVEVVDAAGPFVVTSQTTNETWYVGSSQIVTWDVAGTDSGAVNTPTVNIRMSTDGGITFPHLLATNIANDGAETIVVPSAGSQGTNTGDIESEEVRVLIEGNGNIFFAVNSSDFTIVDSEFVLVLENAVVEVCSPNTTVYNFTYSTFSGFTGTTTFSANNLPEGAVATFNPTTASADGTAVTITISGIGNVSEVNSSFKIVGTSGAVINSAQASLTVYSSSFNELVLTAPLDASIEASITPRLTWDADSNAASYDVQMATDSAFTNIIAEENITNNTYAFSLSLVEKTTYYWRVKAKNDCEEGSFSVAFSFTTKACDVCDSFGETSYATSTTLVQFNTINNVSAKPSGYSDYTSINTVVKLNESHGLAVNVNTDGSYRLQVKAWIDWNQNCSFDDAGEEYDLGFASNTGNGATDLSPLSITVPGDASLGSTIMRVSSRFTDRSTITYPTSCEENFDGEVEDYTIILEDATASIDDIAFEGFNLFPNPSNGTFNLSFKTEDKGNVSVQLFDLAGRLIDEKNYDSTDVNFSKVISFKDTSFGLYLLKVTSGKMRMMRKLIIK